MTGSRGMRLPVVAALVLALGAAACSTSTSVPSPATSPPATSSPEAAPLTSETPHEGTEATSSPATSSGESEASPSSVDGIPIYQPSTLVSQATGSTVLRTPDPIDKVGAYYVNFVDTNGWQTVSRTVTQNAASLTVKKSGRGASIAVGRDPQGGTQTVIAISTYPSG